MDVNPGWCHVYLIAGLLNAMGGYYEDEPKEGSRLCESQPRPGEEARRDCASSSSWDRRPRLRP